MTVFTEAVLTTSTTLLVVNLLVGITCQKQSRPSGVSCLSQVTADKVRCGLSYHTNVARLCNSHDFLAENRAVFITLII